MIDLPREVRVSDSRTEYGSEQALPLIVAEAAQCRAVFALQGAQLLSFVPTGDEDWLWLSPKAVFSEGSAIRGGIPLCLPWFGVNRRDATLPKHGFARQREWQLLEASSDKDGLILRFAIESTPEEQARFPWAYSAQVAYRLGRELECDLVICNRSQQSLPLSFAMHSYFAADTAAASVQGLGDGDYLDNTQGLAKCRLTAAQRFDGEVDRVFEQVGGVQELATGKGPLAIAGQGCDTVVVWNPGAILADKMDDVAEHYSDYICVERGMAFADELLLPPKGCHHAQMRIWRP